MSFLRNKYFLISSIFLFLILFNILFTKLVAIEFISLLSYLLLSWLFGVVLFRPILKVLPRLGVASYGIAKVVGQGIFFYILWYLHHLELLRGPWTSSLMLLCTIFIFFKYSQESYSELLLKNLRELLSIEALFFTVFFVFLAIYSLHPELYWGEKPMDFTLLNFFSRYPSLPPEDPWFAGERMHYYYWGYFFLANLSNMAGLGLEASYGCGLALCASLLSVGLYSVLSLWVKKVSLRFGFALILIFSANLAAFIRGIGIDRALDMRFFWSSTRVFSKGAFAEYPSWSFLFADLHAHVISYPFTVVFLALLLYGLRFIWSEFEIKRHWLFLGVYSFSYGLLALVNGWDLIFYTILAIVLWVLKGPRYWKRLSSWWSFLVAHVLGLVLMWPVFLTLFGGIKKKLLLSSIAANDLNSFIIFFGSWLVLISLGGGAVALQETKSRNKDIHELWDNGIIPLFIGLFCIVLVAENIIFMDRINTIFKTYTNIFSCLGLLSLGMCSVIFRKTAETDLKKYILKIFFSIVVSLNFTGFILNTYTIIKFRPFMNSQHGLIGTEYISKINLDDFLIIEWLRKNIVGIPTILEKDSSSFDHNGARISMHTGLPTYLGWHNHVRIRGAKNIELNKRRSVIAYLYDSTDALKVYEKLVNIGVQFIVVGRFERNKCASDGLRKFEAYSDLFTPLVENRGKTLLYGVGNYKEYLKSK